MSLSLPAVYSSASKQGNIQENWIVQLGFYNGDSDGSGDGGWDAVLQTDNGAANLINRPPGSELVTSGGNLAPNGNWTIRDADDGGTSGWSGANPPVYQDAETSSMVNGLTGDYIDAGKNYSLTFTVAVATLRLAIGGGDLSGNSADETYIASTGYAVGTHTVTFPATDDATHLWLTAYTGSAGNGTLDDVILKVSGYGTGDTDIIVDDGTVFVAGDFIKIENEIIKITSISTHTLTVVRGAMSTTVAAHNNDTAIYWNNFTPIALSDTTVDSVFYRGVITNTPSIRTSFDLARSTAKTGNISLNLPNFQYQGDDFSAELFLGTRKYINREVRIYSQLNDGTWEGGSSTLSNCLQIYSGRLIDISHDDSKIILQLTEQRPWDFITTPVQRSSFYKHIFPIAYGDFVANQSTTGSETYCTGKKLFPIPIDYISGNTIYSLMFKEQAIPTSGSGSGATSPNPHHYEKNLDKFIPLYETSSATADDESSSYAGGFGLISYWALKRAVKFKPDGVSDDGGFASAASAFDTTDADDTGTSYAREVHDSHVGEANEDMHFASLSGTNSRTASSVMKLTIPQMSGKYSAIKVEIRARIHGELTTTASVGSTATITCKLKNNSGGADTTLATATQTTPDETFHTGASYADYSDVFTTEYLAGEDGLSTIDIEAESVFTRASNAVVADFDVFFDIVDVRIYGTLEIDFDETSNKNLQGGTDIVYSLDTLYTGGNGLDASYSGGSSSVTTGLGMHRDLLARFTNYDAADGSIYNWGTSFPSSGSLDIEDLRLDSSSWGVRWWASEPIDLKKILEQIQYEFCFIFKWRAEGSGSYWIIKDSYSAGDVTQTFTKNDITNLKISNTPFSELLTEMDINSERHPAENKYLSSQTSKDTTNNPRTDWNIQSKENIKEINLDMNIDKIGNTDVGGGDPNDGFADYYLNIFGDIKKIISCDIVNPAVSYNLETGDIVKFSNTAGEMPVDPFGDNWADYYMITTLNRSLGKVSITVREVG